MPDPFEKDGTHPSTQVPSLDRHLFVGALAFIFIVVGMGWFSLRQSRTQYDQRAAATTQNLARVLNENLAGRIAKADIALLAVVDEAERQLAAGSIRKEALDAFIIREHSRLAGLGVFRATNAAGEAIYGPAVLPASTTSLAHRDYFRLLKDQPGSGLVISKPLIGGISGKWMVILARRINEPQGAFAGLVYAGIMIDYLVKDFANIDVGKHGGISLLDADGTLVARYPAGPAIEQWIGRRINSKPLEDLLAADQPMGTYAHTSSLDATERIFSFQRLDLPRPFVILVGLAVSDYLGEWRSEAWKLSLIMGVFSLLAIIAALHLRREWRRTEAEVAHRKASEAALRASESMYRELLDRQGTGFSTIDAQERFLLVNPAAEAVFGVAPGRLLGRSLLEFLPPDQLEKLREESSLRAQGIQSTYELQIRREDGALRTLLVTASPRSDQAGRVPQTIGVFRDITDAKQAEAERATLAEQQRQFQKAESLALMAGAIAHHFNNKLQSVMANLDVASDLPPGLEATGHLAMAKLAAEKAGEVSRQLLVYLGQTSLGLEPCSLPQLLGERLPRLQKTLPSTVTLELDCPVPGPVVHANADQLEQVLASLVTNAWEALGPSGGCVRLGLSTCAVGEIPTAHRFPIGWQPTGGNYACLAVADSGCGIAGADLEKLFDPFFTTKFIGRGLGLPVVLGIVQAHGGAVTVDTQLGRGSVFRVHLPLSAEVLSAPPLPVVDAPTPAPGGTVLLVDDDEMLLSSTAALIGRLGFSLLTAKDGVEAVEVFRQHRAEICCVLTDLTMPRLDGWGLLTALRQLDPDLPVILASGYDKGQVLADTHPDQPQAFLSKPFDLRQLREALGQALAASSRAGEK